SAISNLASLIEETHAEVTWEPMPAVSGDPVRLIQLFQNLIGNGIKYRRANVPPCIRISSQQRGSLWTFSVQDNGVGIEPDDMGKIFLSLMRLHGPEISGSGLGLAICKSIVGRRGGYIWVESMPE